MLSRGCVKKNFASKMPGNGKESKKGKGVYLSGLLRFFRLKQKTATLPE